MGEAETNPVFRFSAEVRLLVLTACVLAACLFFFCTLSNVQVQGVHVYMYLLMLATIMIVYLLAGVALRLLLLVLELSMFSQRRLLYFLIRLRKPATLLLATLYYLPVL